MLRPIRDRVLVKRKAKEEVTRGGIIIPEMAKEKPVYGEVVALGRGSYEYGEFIPTELKVGDMVLIGKYSGTEVTIDDQEFTIIKESEVIGVVG